MVAALIRDRHAPRSFWKARLLPLSVLLISISWIFHLHIYLQPDDPCLFYVLISLAFALLVVRVFSRAQEPWTEKLRQPPWAGFVGFIACIAIILIYPLPYTMGAFPLALGWLFISRLPKSSLAGYFSTALIQVGLLLLLSAGVLPLVFAWSARVHELSGPGYFFTPALNFLLNLFGQRSDLIGSRLYLHSFEDLFPQTVTTEKLLPVPVLLFTILWSAVILLRSEVRRFERLIFFWIGLSLYSLLRLAVLMILMIQRINPSYYYDPLVMAVSILPIIFIVREPDDLPRVKRMSTRPLKKGVPPAFSLIVGFLMGISIIVALTFYDPGKPKFGRVLVNEHGSDWEWTTEPMDTTVYSEKTTYNYYCLAEYLKYFYDVTINFDPLSPAVLENIDVLILKIPTEPYQPQEIDAVVDFVKRGGGVWVIGDHTNVFGSSSFFNPLLARFDCRLHYTSTHDLETGRMTLFQKPPLFAQPSVVNLPPYLFATSCTMTAPWNAEGAIIGYSLRTDYLDYSQKNFFPDRNRKLFDIGFGLFLQQVGLYKGKGRLLIYTDSTTFSNFFMFIRGKPELVLGSVDWLNRVNRYKWLNTAALIIGLLLVVVLVLSRSWNGAIIASFILGLALTGWFTDYLTRTSYPLPEPHQEVPHIQFDREYSDYFLPTLRLSEEGDKSVLTFYVWTQRLGLVPREAYDLQEALSGDDPLVIIDPVDELRTSEITSLYAFVQGGGQLLLLNSADNSSSTPLELADKFDMNLKMELCPSDTLHTLTLADRYFPLRINDKFSSVEGGEVLLTSDQGDPLAVKSDVGQGRVIVVACGHIFRDSAMGPTTIVPDDGLKALYQVEYQLILELIGESSAED